MTAQSRNSKKRTEILNVIKDSKNALSAAEIHTFLPHIDLATIYRNLDRFSDQKVIKKIRLNDKQAQYEHQNEKHHHAVCKAGDNTIHFQVSENKIVELLGLKDFKIDDVDIIVTGSCNSCYEIQN